MEAKKATIQNVVYDILGNVINNGIGHQNVSSKKIIDSKIEINGKELINFGSCSYLGLELDPRLKEGAIDAIHNFGTQFSSSRAYCSLGLYEQLESEFEKMYNNKVIVMPNCALTHISAIPSLITENDAIIFDHQVHTSVQNAISIVKSKGTNIHVEPLRHNKIDVLESKIIQLSKKYEKIWYMADGVYSMYGDVAPLIEVQKLLEKYENFHFYVDDAHGMSCYGKNGCGYVLSKIALHSRMVLVTSLSKAFATGGALIVFNDEKFYNTVKRCGSTFITSGPLQPGSLGAMLACVKIHNSDEIYKLQKELSDKIVFCTNLINETNLPLIKDNESPIFFIGLGTPLIGYELIKRLKEKGFFSNIGIFPAVPLKNTGIRFTITRNLTYDQIRNFIDCLNYEFNSILLEKDIELSSIYNAFKISPKTKIDSDNLINNEIISSIELKSQIYYSITEIDKIEWNNLYKHKGTFDWDTMLMNENTFQSNKEKHNNWKFHYIIIRDTKNNIVCCSPVTTALLKDDMLMSKSISENLESQRKNNPYFMCSQTTMTGCAISNGEHLFIDTKHYFWKEALINFLQQIQRIQEITQSESIILRDFPFENQEVFDCIEKQGYFKNYLPEMYIQNTSNWNSELEFYQLLKGRKKDHFNSYVKKNLALFKYEKEENISDELLEKLYSLYLNVREKSLQINTFDFPISYLKNIAKSKNWEIFTLRFKENPNCIVGVSFNHINQNEYSPMLVGLDYTYQDNNIYRILLYHTLLRSKALNIPLINLGFGTGLPKKSLNFEEVSICSFVQLQDHFNFEYMSNLQKVKEPKIRDHV